MHSSLSNNFFGIPSQKLGEFSTTLFTYLFWVQRSSLIFNFNFNFNLFFHNDRSKPCTQSYYAEVLSPITQDNLKDSEIILSSMPPPTSQRLVPILLQHTSFAFSLSLCILTFERLTQLHYFGYATSYFWSALDVNGAWVEYLLW